MEDGLFRQRRLTPTTTMKDAAATYRGAGDCEGRREDEEELMEFEQVGGLGSYTYIIYLRLETVATADSITNHVLRPLR